jgi:hypothetical protein
MLFRAELIVAAPDGLRVSSERTPLLVVPVRVWVEWATEF